MDYQKNIKELEVYFHFDATTIKEIVEYYWTWNGSRDLPNNITKLQAIEALMDWLQDKCSALHFGAWVGDSVDYLKETVEESWRLEEVLEMKKAHDKLEDMSEELQA